VGVVLVDGGRRILTADSDRFNTSGASSGLTVINTQAALNGSQEGLGSISTGLFPREFAVSPDGSTLLVTDYQSLQLQAIDIRTLP
jgi:DNA-binding beta-propeller fold protein YncE